MIFDESDEVFPLLEQNRRNGNEGNSQYQTLLQSEEAKRNDFLKRRLNYNFNVNERRHKANTSLCDVRTQTTERCEREEVFTDSKINYSWNYLNVCCPVINKNMSTWDKIRNTLLRSDLYVERESKSILKNAYGMAHPGELLAILGSSGAGKTTLLNALTFQTTPNYEVKGFRYLNGHPINNRNIVSKLSAYVEQDNIFLGTLTVKEHLIFQSLVRMDRRVSYSQKLMRVNEVINELGLEKCQDTVIGYPGRTKGISGGEMRRLSLASEVLTNPPLMFCDEPTSGLDSFIALNVITLLKSMAIRGKTVICTIHQPSSEIFSLFDKILLLAEGRTAFLGKPNEALSFFSELGVSPMSKYNPAEFLIQTLAVLPGQEERCRGNVQIVCDYFDQSPFGLEVVTEIECEAQSQADDRLKIRKRPETNPYKSQDEFDYPASWFLQFRALFWRSWINIIKEPLFVKVRLFQTIVLSLVVGIIYQGQKLNEDGVMNINGVLFTFLTNMTFQNLFAVISVFCSELPVFMKEHSKKMYRVDAYFLSKTFTEIPIFLIIPSIFTSITYFWINLNPKFDHFVKAVAILILVTNVATSFGYFISCISKNVVMALSIGPPVIIPFLLFGGFLLNSGAVPSYFKWLSYFSWFKYGNEALLINQWSDVERIECNRSNITCPKTGQIVLEIYHFQKENFLWDIISLFLLIIFFRLLAFLALFVRTLNHRKV